MNPRWRVLANVLVFLTTEEKQFIFDDWAIEVPTEVVESKFGSNGREEVTGVELVVAQKFKDAAVIIVTTTTCHDVDRSTGIATVFSRKI